MQFYRENQESLSILKHYRPFRYLYRLHKHCEHYLRNLEKLVATHGLLTKQSTRSPNHASKVIRAGSILSIIIVVSLGTSAVAFAQQSPVLSTSVSVKEANRKGREAFEKDDYVTAIKWYRSAADQGDAEAQDAIGFFYVNGMGVRKDAAAAMMWFRRAADQGFADAQCRVGNLYLQGEGVPEDPGQAAIWFRKSAEQGYAEAQLLLGIQYVSGEGLRRDYALAMSWLRKSADQGNTSAQEHIGSLYRDGYGVPKDYAQASTWYRKAASNGNENAKKELASLQRQMRVEATDKKERIPAALQFRCWLETSPPSEDEKIQTQRYQACLRSNWKRLTGSQPFPGE